MPEAETKEAPSSGSGQVSQDELSALRQAVAEGENRLAQLEEAVKTAEMRLASQAEELQRRETDLVGLREKLAGAAAKYRQMLLAGSPEIPEELVNGETVEAVEVSFAQARQVVDRVRRSLEASLQQARVPAGAPPRVPLDLSALSPQEKIAYALARR